MGLEIMLIYLGLYLTLSLDYIEMNPAVPA